MSKRLEDLLKKREELNAEIQKVRARQTAQERKEDTRRKILLGALVREMMAKGELDEGIIMKRLEGFLTRDIDRKLFNLTLLGDDKGEDKTTGESGQKKASSSKTTTGSKKEIKRSSEPKDSQDKLEDSAIPQAKHSQENKEEKLESKAEETNRDNQDKLESQPVETNQDNQDKLEGFEGEINQEKSESQGGEVNQEDLAIKEKQETFPEVEEKLVEIILEDFPHDQKLAIIKILRKEIGLELKEGKQLIESTPCLVKKTTQGEADLLKKQLEEAGATISLKVES